MDPILVAIFDCKIPLAAGSTCPPTKYLIFINIKKFEFVKPLLFLFSPLKEQTNQITICDSNRKIWCIHLPTEDVLKAAENGW